MDAAPPVRRRPFALKFEAVLSLFVGAVLLAGGAVSLYTAIPGARYLYAYESAPPCATVSAALAAADCRFSGTASVTETGNITLGGRVFDTTIQPGDFMQLQTDQVVQVELWRGLVTELDGTATMDSPEVSDNWATPATLGALLVLLGVGLLVWGIRKWRRRDEDPDGQTMAPLAVSDALFHGQ